jgi:CDP-diacylglycerol---serine O-phosphatidyltransferase
MIRRITEIKVSYRIIVMRIILALLIVPLLFAGEQFVAAFFFILAGLLSMIEDFVTRRFAYRTPKRVIADYVADKALISISAAALWFLGAIPWWLAIIVLGKDAIMIIASFILIWRSEYVELKPVITAKIAYMFQWVSVLLAMLHAADSVLFTITTISTVIAGIEAFWKSEFRKMRKKRSSQFSLVGMVTVADIITLGNGIAGLASILYAIQGEFKTAAVLMLAAVILDFLDGKVARILKQQHEFGKELDSLADTISFGVAPAIFAYGLIQTKIAMVAFIIFVFCGVLRLARYNILAASGVKGFIGMPITVNGMVVPLLFFFQTPIQYYPYIYLVLSFLMVSTIRMKKL